MRLRQTGMLRWVVIHKSYCKCTTNVLPIRHPGLADALRFFADQPLPFQDHSPTLTATEIREKLLREKVKALRKSSGTQKELDADGV